LRVISGERVGRRDFVEERRAPFWGALLQGRLEIHNDFDVIRELF
jgi:hypothetical protein